MKNGMKRVLALLTALLLALPAFALAEDDDWRVEPEVGEEVEFDLPAEEEEVSLEQACDAFESADALIGGEEELSFAQEAAAVAAAATIDADSMTTTSDSITLGGVAGQEYIILPKGTAVTDESWKNAIKPDAGKENAVAFTKLNAATAYDIWARVAATETEPAGEAKKAEALTLLNSVETRQDSMLVGATMTVLPDPKEREYTYVWYQDTVSTHEKGYVEHVLKPISGATGNSYTFRAEDVGKHIAVKVLIDDHEMHSATTDDPVSNGVVTFESNGGSAVEPQKGLKYKDKVTKPADPTREDYSFEGWFKEAELKNEWSFDKDTVIDAETTIFAKWVMNPPATVTTAPKARELTYTGEAQALVEPGEAKDGKLVYSLDGKTWSETVPTGKDAGSYAVQYKAEGDDKHVDSEAASVTTTITAKPSGQLFATMVSEGEKSLKLTWSAAQGVGGYDVFLKPCDGKGGYPLLGTVEGGGVTGYTVTGLNKGASYKAYVRAWVMSQGKKEYVLKQSPEVHAYTNNGTAKVSNPGSVTVKKPAMTVKLGKTATIKGSVKGIKKGKLKNHVSKLRYFSSDTAVATVTSKGKVKAVGAGSCQIYVLTTNGLYTTVTVAVDTNPTKIALSKVTKTMKVGKTQNLGPKAKLTPAKALTTLTWTSSNPAVATVDASGVVTAIKKGKAVITVSTANGKKAKVTIRVK